MLNREFSVKLKLPPATVNNFDLVLCHCDFHGKVLRRYSYEPGDLPNSKKESLSFWGKRQVIEFYHS